MTVIPIEVYRELRKKADEGILGGYSHIVREKHNNKTMETFKTPENTPDSVTHISSSDWPELNTWRYEKNKTITGTGRIIYTRKDNSIPVFKYDDGDTRRDIYVCWPCRLSTGGLKRWEKHVTSKKHKLLTRDFKPYSTNPDELMECTYFEEDCDFKSCGNI